MPGSSEARKARLEARRRVKSRQRVRQAERDLRDAARRAVKNARARGELVAPARCERCSAPGPHLHAHHADYAKPLEVIWLCLDCHSDEHGYRIPRLPGH